MRSEIVYVLRFGRIPRKGSYFTRRPRTGACGQILLGGGSIPMWVQKQKYAMRFRSAEKAKAAAGIYAGRSRVVKLRAGSKQNRAERAEKAGWTSALHEVRREVKALELIPTHEAQVGFNLALERVDSVVQKLLSQT